MLNAAVGLDLAIPSMVIGDQQALVGDDLPGATAAKLDDSVLQTVVVNAVDLFRRQLEAKLLHVFIVQPVDEHRDPHPFIRLCKKIKGQDEDQN